MWKKVAIVVAVSIVVMYLLSPADKLHTLKGKRVLLTGASTGIGEQMAYHYAKYGANLVITARRQKVLDQVIEKCKSLAPSPNVKLVAIASDMSIRNDTKRIIEAAIKVLGGIDVLVLNHVSGFKVVRWEGSPRNMDDFEFDMNVNFRSYVHLTAHALPQLKKNSGGIIIVNALAGKMPLPGMPTYAAVKHALEGFFHSIKNEFIIHGEDIAVTNCIVGLIDTDNVMEKMEKYLGGSTVFLSAHTAKEAAFDMVEAGARRVERMYTPNLSGRIMTLMYNLWPAPMEWCIRTMIGSMVDLDL